MISAIVAVAEGGVIGDNNQIPWYLPADLAYFKRVTHSHPIIMGRNCFESIGRPLPHRTNIVVTRNPFYVANGVTVLHNIAEAMAFAKSIDTDEIFIIGGAEIYAQTMPECDRLYYTEVAVKVAGDVLFPAVDWDDWQLISSATHLADAKNEYDYTFKVFDRR
jgi:dihydrofolate reductase